MSKHVRFFSLFLVVCIGSYSRAHAVLIAGQDFDGGTPTWSFTPDPAAGSFTNSEDVWDIVSSVGTSGNAITMTGNFWGARDVENGDNPRGGDGLLTFSNVNLDGFTNAVLTFDYSAFEYDNGDDIFYTVFFDNVAQPLENLVNGASNLSASGTVTELIPDTVTTVSLVVEIDQNGGGDWAGVDNFAINAVAIPEPSAFLFGGLICGILGTTYSRKQNRR